MLEFHSLRIDLPDAWTALRKATVTSDMLELVLPDTDTRSIVVLPPLAFETEGLGEALDTFVVGHTHGREILKRFPDEPLAGTTTGGLPLRAQHAVTAGDDVWFAMYWALQVGPEIQCVVGIAASPDDYQTLLPQLGGFIDGLTS